MRIEGGLPTLLGLFCEVNAGVLALMYGEELGRCLRARLPKFAAPADDTGI